jgi:hypothetical protein
MIQQTFLIDIGKANLLDIDTDEFGNYLAITDENEIITDTFRIKIPMELRFPKVRKITNDLFLVISSQREKTDNAWILNTAGEIQLSFFAGICIQDILVFSDKIVFTYFDEGVYGTDGPNNEGLAVFSLQGEMLYGFNSTRTVFIADCYCACKSDKNTVLFYAYGEFQMIALDLDTFKWHQYETPMDFAGASSMVYKNGQVILHGTYNNKENFFLWNIPQHTVTTFGSFTGQIKGLENGKFISFKYNGFEIIDPINHA